MISGDTAKLAPTERAHVIADTIVRPTADDVDASARFPHESLAAIREARLLSTMIPAKFGGEGTSFRETGGVVEQLARGCASTAMIYAMHQVQVACLVRHALAGGGPGYLREVAAGELLLASATSEVGIGGDIRSSLCAVEINGDQFVLLKNAPVVSYGQFADALLVTARRKPDSAPSDQVLVLCERSGLELAQTGTWETLGLRGTCSPPFSISASGSTSRIFEQPFADILAQTMHPVSHALWASVWLGMATEAYNVARRYIQEQARRSVGRIPPEATRLAELATAHHQLVTLVHAATERLDAADAADLAAASSQVEMNAVKVAASTLVVDIVGQAMLITGMAGYRTNSECSLGRLLRDAYGTKIMINNDRIMANSAHLLLTVRS